MGADAMMTLVLLSLAAAPNPFARELQASATRRALEARLPKAAAFLDKVATPTIDYRHQVLELRWDFRSGVVDGQATLTFRAYPGAQAQTLPLLVDPGITSLHAEQAGSSLQVTRQPLGDQDYVQVSLPVAVDETHDVVVELRWSGTLRCTAPGSSVWSCTTGATPFAWMDQGTGVPLLLDPVMGASLDALTRRWTLRTPPGFVVWGPGDPVSSTPGATEWVSVWETNRPTSLGLASWIITGTALAQRADAQWPVLAASSAQVDAVWGWAQQILPEGRRRFGDLATRTAAQIIVPRSSSFIGTASAATTLINETYDGLGPTLHEEIWAHENIHQHFAVRAYPADIRHSSLMTEGITTLLQLDYTNRSQRGEARDLALGLRQREFGLLLDYRFPHVLAVPQWVSDQSLIPSDPYDHNVWAYFKGAATLEVLRVMVGDEVFDQGLNRYLAACDLGPCETEDFEHALEQVSGLSLTPFFDAWVRGAPKPQLTIGWGTSAAQVLQVVLSQSQPGLVPVELWLELETGAVERVPWVLSAAVEVKNLTTTAPVRRVTLNPRLQGAVPSRSSVDGDVDFDGEVDGFDVIHCARLVGHTLTAPQRTHGLWNTNLEFDSRCDLDHDGTIDAQDVSRLPFPALRSSP